MDISNLPLVVVAFFLAALVKGVTGLGFSTTALPILAIGIGLKEALPLVLVPSLCSNALVMFRTPGFRLELGRFRWMYVATVVGLAGGLAVLSRLDGDVAGVGLGVMLAVWCAYSIARPQALLPPRIGERLAPISGFLTGLTNGVTGSQVMPLLPYLMSLNLPRDNLIQASNISFSLSSIIMAFGLSQIGLLSVDAIVLSAVGLLPMYLGIETGQRLRARLPADAFRSAVLLVLGMSGLSLVFRPLFGGM